MAAEVRLYDRDGTTLRGTLAGLGLSWSTAKGPDGDDISFTVSRLEDDYTPTILDDALAIVYADMGSGLVPVGTPYVLTPTGGTVFGEGVEDNIRVAGKGALSLTGEWPVLHHWETKGIISRIAPQSRTFGWPTPEFDDTSWTAADVQDPEATTFAKLGRPQGFGDGYVAQWAYKIGGGGNLTLFRIGTFTVTTQRKYVIRSTSDEEHKLYLNGHLIGEESDQETGYTHFLEWQMVLAPGDYFLAAEMTTVNSAGGDGFDALRAFVATVGQDGEPDTVVLKTDTTTKVLKQSKADPRPGLTTGELLLLAQDEAQGWLGGIPSASLLTASFDAALDSYGDPWPEGREITVDVGPPWSTVIADLSGTVDVWVDTSFGWHAAPQRGETNTVQLVQGSTSRADTEGVLSYTYEDANGITATRAIAQTSDGFVVYQDATLEASVDARTGYVESSEAQSIGEGLRLAEQWVDENSTVRRTFTAEVRGVAGAIPWADFDWGWAIGAFDETGATAQKRVVSIAGKQGEVLTFTYELGAV